MRRFLVALALLALIGLGAWRWRAWGRVAWTALAPGVEICTLSMPAGGLWGRRAEVTALRCAPGRVGVVAGPRLQHARDWRRQEKALAAVNGGFFDEYDRPLGLCVSGGRTVTPLRGVNWGVFYVRRGRAHLEAHIAHTRDFKLDPKVREAIQCGPRLVVAGRVTDLKAQWARRTGIGVQRDGRVVIAVADGDIALRDWAALWAARNGLNCRDALNLDGGPSTQLSLQTPSRALEIAGPNRVPDVVVIQDAPAP